jgi:hypothetical protein
MAFTVTPRLHVEDRDRGPRGGEGAGDRGSDPGRSAGHDRDLVAQVVAGMDRVVVSSHSWLPSPHLPRTYAATPSVS